MSGAMGGSGAGDEAHMLASASMLNREIENAKTLVCKVLMWSSSSQHNSNV